MHFFTQKVKRGRRPIFRPNDGDGDGGDDDDDADDDGDDGDDGDDKDDDDEGDRVHFNANATCASFQTTLKQQRKSGFARVVAKVLGIILKHKSRGRPSPDF